MAERRPNILILNPDQQRYDCLGVNGHPLVQTPHIDSLAAGGMSFTRAYTPCPVCCPARATLISGVMPEQHGSLWNYDNGSPMHGLSPDWHCWVRDLRTVGYHTGYVGEWHVSGKDGPEVFGFEQNQPKIGGAGNGGELRQIHTVSETGQTILVGYEDTGPLEQNRTHVQAHQAITMLEEFTGTNDPWHLRVDFAEPHLPCVPCQPYSRMYPPSEITAWPSFSEKFAGKPLQQERMVRNWGLQDWTWDDWAVYLSGYLGIVSQVDHAIGLILQRLEELGQLENTLIIYTSDHGDAAGGHRMMDKHYIMYEDVVHVPLIMRWDGHITAGSSCPDFLVHFLDLPPTLLDILDLPTPDHYQGRSFASRLRGESPTNPRDHVFSTYSGQQFGLYSQRMIRDDRYKLVWNPTDLDEFYDLEQDPAELHNLINSPETAPLVQQYRTRLHETYTELGDRLMVSPWMRRQLRGPDLPA